MRTITIGLDLDDLSFDTLRRFVQRVEEIGAEDDFQVQHDGSLLLVEWSE